MNGSRTELAEHFLALLRPLRQELEVYCRRLVWNEHEAPDALQNAALKAFKAFDRYHDAGNFRAWMFKILTHEIFKVNNKSARVRQNEYPLDPEALDAMPSLGPSSEPVDWLCAPEALANALDQELVAGLKTLTETERAALLLRGIGEFRYREIAEALDIPLGSVMGNLARARHKMRRTALRLQQRSEI